MLLVSLPYYILVKFALNQHFIAAVAAVAANSVKSIVPTKNWVVAATISATTSTEASANNNEIQIAENYDTCKMLLSMHAVWCFVVIAVVGIRCCQ